MKDIYKSKKQLIQELEQARRLLSQKVVGEAGADISGQKATSATLLLMQKAIYSATDAIEVSDPEGHHIYQNRAYTDLFEYTDEELDEAGGGIAVFEVNSIGQQVFECIRGGESWKGEVEVRSKSGRVFCVLLRADAIKDDEGKIVGLMGIYTDISERKRLEYQLRRKHDELQLILDSIPAYVFYKDREGKLLNINKAAMSLAYAPKEKLLQKTVYDLTPQAADRYNRDDMEVIRSGLPKVNIEEPLDLPSGKRWLKTDKLPIKDDEGNTLGLVGFSVDITDRKKAEEELLQSEALLRSFFNSPGLICGVVEIEDDDIRYITVNAALAGMYGLRPEDVSGKLTSEIGTDKEITGLFIENYRRSLNTSAPAYFEYCRGSGAETRWLSVMVTYLGLESGRKKPRFAFITSDITERRKAEEAQRTSEEKLRIMFESMTDSVVLTDLNGTVLDANASALKTFGYEKSELLGRNGLDIVAFEDRDRALKNLATSMHGEEIKGIQEYRIMDRKGNMLETEITVNRLSDGSGKPYGFIVVIRDVTAKKVAEEQLKVSESRMRSLFQVSPDVIMNIDRQGKILFINRATTRSVEETIGTMVFDYIPPEYHTVYAETIERVYSTGKPGSIEIRGLGPGKRVSWYEARFVTVESGGDQRTLMVAATDITERRQAEEALKESESKYRFLTESMNDIVWTVDMNFRSTYVSPSHTRILGYTPEERIGQLAQKFVTEESFKRCIDALAYEMERDGKEGINPNRNVNIEIEYYHKNGSTVWMEDVVTAIRDDEGKPIGLHGVSRDITERKKAEDALRESEQKLRWMFSSMADGVVVTDLEGRITDLNESQLRMFGFRDKGELIGKGGLDFLAERERGKALAEMFQVYERGVNTGSIYTVVDRDGREFECELSTAMLHDAAGKPSGTVTVMRDVTERTRMEQQLRESEERYRLLAENVSDVIWTMDLNLRFTYISPSVQHIRGYTAEEALGLPLEETVTPDSMKTVLQVVKEEFEIDHTEQYVSRTIEVELKCKDGSTVWTEMKLSWLHDTAGNRIGIMGVTRDITERRKAQEALRETSEKLRVVFDSIGEAVTVVDLNGSIVDANKEALRLHGFVAKDAIVGKKSSELVAPVDRGRAVKDAINALKGDSLSGRTECKLIDMGGREFDGEFNVAVIRDSMGNPAGFIGVARDITERKRMQDELQRSEEFFKEITENSSDIIIITDKEGNVKYCSRSVERFTGYRPEEIVGSSAFKFIHSDDVQRAVADYNKAIQTKDTAIPNSFRIVHKNGSERFFEGVGKNLLHNPSITGFIMNVRDVTERKGMEEALRQSQETLRAVFDTIGDVVLVTDVEGKITDVNSSVLNVFGYEKKDVVGRSGFDMVAPEYHEAIMKELTLSVSQGFIGRSREYKIIASDGRRVDCDVVTSRLNNSDGRLKGFVAVIRDITQRKLMEEALRNSEERYRGLVENASEIIFSLDAEGRITYISPSVEASLGYKPAELIDHHFKDLILQEDFASLVDGFGRTLRGEKHRDEVSVRARSGDVRVIRISVKAVSQHGKIVALTGVGTDITERKLAEEALRQSEEKLRVMFDSMMDGIVVSDKNLAIVDVNRAAVEIMGVDAKEELLGRNAMEVIRIKDQAVALANLEKIFKEGRSQEKVEYDVILPSGKELDIEVSTAIMQDSAGDITGFVNAIRDITERKRLEGALQQKERYFRALIESSSDGIMVLNPDGTSRYESPGCLRLVGYTADERVGHSVFELIHPEDIKTGAKVLERALFGIAERAELRVHHKDGSWHTIEVVLNNLIDDPAVGGVVANMRDVTERKRAEDALKKSEVKYRSLVEREKDVIVSVDALGFVKSVNSAVTAWGYTPDQVLKMNFLELIAPEWREVTATELQGRLLETGEYVGETMVVRKDGEMRPIEYSAVVIEEEGQYTGAQAIVRDISERKKAEEALQARERYFRAISDQSSGAALVVNLEGNIMDVTGGLERISGHTRESTIGRSAIEFIHPDDMGKAGQAFDESIHSPGKTVAFEARLKNARGEWQWTESMITNLLDNPDVHGIVNHLVDITERKKIEEEIKNHAKRIEALYSVAQVISQSVTLDAMLNDSLDRVCSAMDTESGLIFMLDLDENALKLKSYKGVEENVREQFSTIALTEQGIENIMKVQGPVTEVDEAHTVADIEGTKKATEELGRKSLAATPLFRGNELQGFLVVFSSKERKFSSEDLDLFKATANEISIGINNLMLLEKTREMSVTDELTGLYNRRYFFDMLDVEINRSGRTGHPFSVIMLDLDGFKEYNDKYGHSNGDAVLETFSRTLKDAVRKSDLVFRYGGDEFALILPSADAERARKIIQRSRAKWEKVMLKQAGIFGGQVGFSSGIAEYPKNAESSDGLVFLADAALYQAKKKGYEDKLVSELRTLSTDIIDIATQDQVYALAATVDARDPYTYGHSQRVADIAMRIGEQIGMTTEDLAKLHAAALLHDIGKVGVPDSILTKPGKPTPEEWDIIKKHCAEGARILGYVKELTTLVPIVLHHHEWYDGSGYPSGLRGLDIPSGARITSVADAYDTMVTKRPYRNEMSRQEACEELKRSAGTQFDPAIVDVWVKLVEQGEK